MAYTLAEALRRYGEQARQAAGAPTVLYLCRDCDHQWVSSDPVCWFCSRVCHREPGCSVFDPIECHGINVGIQHTGFETLGL